MFTPEKINEWLKEVEERPSSAQIIIQFIANRLNDLSEWNEKLRAENIALRTSKKVASYERQIAHLQYQLDLIKRQYGGQLPATEQIEISKAPEETQRLCVLIYTRDGRLLRLEVAPADLANGRTIGTLSGLSFPDESPRLLVVPANEELLLVFASGRIAALPVSSVPVQAVSADVPLEWEQISIPNAPVAGDTLSSLTPISRLALADYFVQFSQRGFIKKIRMALAPSILENRYIGTGANISHDRPFDLALCRKDERYVLVSRDGYLRYPPVDASPYAIIEAIRLKSADRLVAAVAMSQEKILLAMTQIGKAIQHTEDTLELVADLGRVGKALYSKTRRESGVRVVGAAAVAESDWGLAIHAGGQISVHAVSQILANGTIPVEGELLSFTAFSGQGNP